MSDQAGQPTAEDHDDLLSAPINENIDNIFDDDDGDDDGGHLVLEHESDDFDSAFDENTDGPPKQVKVSLQEQPEKNNENSEKFAGKHEKARRSSKQQNDSADVGWQNDAADIPHRRELIRQIAQLLRDRKQNPSAKWMKELPYKARKLEEQLYKTAPSLEAYMEKTTLKHRLKKVAHDITSKFRLTKKLKVENLNSSRSSIISQGSTRSSISSIGTDEPQQAGKSLQEQIEENIRQQQQIMIMLMATGSSQQGGNMNTNANTMMNPAMTSQMNQLTTPFADQSQNPAQMAGFRGIGGIMGASAAVFPNAQGINSGATDFCGLNTVPGLTGAVNAAAYGTGMSAALNMSSINPLLVQQLMRQQMSIPGQPPVMTSQSTLTKQMLINSLTGQTNPMALSAALMASGEGYTAGLPAGNNTVLPLGDSNVTVLPSPQNEHSFGTNPTMPPPDVNATLRSSFASISTPPDAESSNDDNDGDLTLSPTSFNW